MARLSRRFQFLNQLFAQSYNPDNAVTVSVWAPALSLAATQAIDVSFFSSSYLDVSVQRVSPRLRVTGLYLPGCPIRISADHFSFANPRGFSQLSTSFFASKSLGIPHTPLFYFTFTYFINSSELTHTVRLIAYTPIQPLNAAISSDISHTAESSHSFPQFVSMNGANFRLPKHDIAVLLRYTLRDVASLKHRAAYL